MTEVKPIQNITIAKLLQLVPEESIQFSEDFLQALKPKKDYQYAIIILTPNTKIVRIIPTETNQVYKISINIGQLSPDFLRSIGNLFLRLGLQSLYSTGLCFVEEKCVFEGYIDSNQFKGIDLNELKKEILDLEGITAVEISILEINE
ncbi:MAG: hypothetical protein GF308_04100 [Candidatus Heimdallarchaeota archaeon]|nr:hypothetical protein [Candidatus Heimdallarchaeota archaeon]